MQYKTRTSISRQTDQKSKRFTIVKPLADYKVPIRMAHLHMFLEITQLVDALLRERHKEHIHRHAGDRVVLRLHIRMFPPPRMLLWLAFSLFELGRIREGL